jgi:hypothetical protein
MAAERKLFLGYFGLFHRMPRQGPELMYPAPDALRAVPQIRNATRLPTQDTSYALSCVLNGSVPPCSLLGAEKLRCNPILRSFDCMLTRLATP